jgi:hypothetical protein
LLSPLAAGHAPRGERKPDEDQDAPARHRGP